MLLRFHPAFRQYCLLSFTVAHPEICFVLGASLIELLLLCSPRIWNSPKPLQKIGCWGSLEVRRSFRDFKMAAEQGGVYIVHLDKTVHPDNIETTHLGVLSSVLGGSHEKAKDAILYSYKNTANGFSAKLTTEQATDLSKAPGVLAVTPQGVKHLHGDAGSTGMKSTGKNAV